MTNRIDVIIRTDFIPAAYALAEVATVGVIVLMIFIKMDPYIEGVIIFAVIVTMLIGLLLLIKDMDNPFEFGSHTYADVDIETLVYLDTYFDDQDAEMERLYAEMANPAAVKTLNNTYFKRYKEVFCVCGRVLYSLDAWW